VHEPLDGGGEPLGEALGDAEGEGEGDALPVGLGDGDVDDCVHGEGVGMLGNSRIDRLNVMQNCVCCPLQFAYSCKSCGVYRMGVAGTFTVPPLAPV